MEQLVFKTEIYEGPLDLLLALIAKNKMSIFDIHIALIFEQYMDYLRQMEELDMEIAGEFITMASELMLIKSKMLLPKQEEDPREELVQQLMEYQSAKRVAGWLSDREAEFGGRFEKDTDDIKPDKHVLDFLESAVLSRAMQHLLLRLSEEEQAEKERPNAIAPLIKRKMVPVQGRIVHILRLMARKKSVHIDEILENVHNRSELVATFYALLELVRVGRIEPFRAPDDETGSNVILNLYTGKIERTETKEEVPA